MSGKRKSKLTVKKKLEIINELSRRNFLRILKCVTKRECVTKRVRRFARGYCNSINQKLNPTKPLIFTRSKPGYNQLFVLSIRNNYKNGNVNMMSSINKEAKKIAEEL